jgi:hypothetical protein
MAKLGRAGASWRRRKGKEKDEMHSARQKGDGQSYNAEDIAGGFAKLKR